MTSLHPSLAPAPRKTRFLPLIAVGVCTFAVGAFGAYGFSQWNAQKAQLAMMTEFVEQMSNSDVQTTRNASLDLLAVMPVSQPETVVPAALTQAEASAVSTADMIRNLTTRAEDPMVANAIAKDEAARSAMSTAISSIKELARATVSGNYTISAEEVAGVGTRLRLNVIGYENTQRELEELLAMTAAADQIAVHNSAVTTDGSIDPQTLVLDFVQRSLENGTAQEQATAAEMNRRALSVSRSQVTLANVTETSGEERYYTVQGGDSLAFISLQFYGATQNYRVIYEANRDQLSTPDNIQIGQRLLIPNV